MSQSIQNDVVIWHVFEPPLVLQGINRTMPQPPRSKPLQIPSFTYTHTHTYNLQLIPRIPDNQINPRIVEKSLHPRKRTRRLVNGVAAPHVRKRRVVKRLHAHRNAVDAKVLQFLQLPLGDVKRMQFDGKLQAFTAERTQNRSQHAQIT